MAKKKTQQKNQGGISASELASRARYPIGLTFQVSTLAGCIAFLVYAIRGDKDMSNILYRSVVVFVGFALCFGVVMVTIVNILHHLKIKEIEALIEKARQESAETYRKMREEYAARHDRQLESNAQSYPLGGNSKPS